MAGSSNPYQLNEASYSQSDLSDMLSSLGRSSTVQHNRRHGSRGSSRTSKRPHRPHRVHTVGSHYDMQSRSPSSVRRSPSFVRRSPSSVHRSPSSMRRDRSIDDYRPRVERGRSMRHKHSTSRTTPHMPSLSQQLRRSNSWASGAMNTHSPPHGMSPKPPLPPIAHNQAAGEKHTPPPYDSVYNRLAGDDVDEELEEIMRARRLKRILKYSAYALILVLTILACALTGYFLTSRTPTVALHAVNSPENLGKKFKLQGTKLQFRIELTYRVQNDNYFDMFVDDISTAVFWPDTKFALGGGRLSNVKVPARRVVEITMPVTVRYDVKRGPPPILLGMVESCGLHDAGIGEMSLEVEVQSDYHTRMKQASIQTGRQAVSVKCPVRHMATLQIGDGASGNIGDIVRTMNA